jgi:actin-related protein 6
VQGAVRRLNLGGRLLTGCLQEGLSYRQYNMMDEVRQGARGQKNDGSPYALLRAAFLCVAVSCQYVIVNAVKEALCYVAPVGVDAEVARAVGSTVKASSSCYAEWVLPSFGGKDDGGKGGDGKGEAGTGESTGHRRAIKVDPDSGRFKRTSKHDEAAAQCLRLESERFLVPELLFRPSDVGLLQGGLHELILEAVAATDPALHPLLFGNIVLTGGCAKLPNLCGRLSAELRPLVPAHLALRITIANSSPPSLSAHSPPSLSASSNDPSSYNWRAAAHVARSGASPVVTKAQYEEMGAGRCNDAFRDW